MIDSTQEVEQDANGGHVPRWQGPIYQGQHTKHRPVVAGGGENLPLEVLRCLSEWISVLEDRGTVPGECFLCSGLPDVVRLVYDIV